MTDSSFYLDGHILIHEFRNGEQKRIDLRQLDKLVNKKRTHTIHTYTDKLSIPKSLKNHVNLIEEIVRVSNEKSDEWKKEISDIINRDI